MDLLDISAELVEYLSHVDSDELKNQTCYKFVMHCLTTYVKYLFI